MLIKNNKGITIIALVITIIVLLIIAGITINMVLGDDGIIEQAQKAKKTNEKTEDEQTEQINLGEAEIAVYNQKLGIKTGIDEDALSAEIKENIAEYNAAHPDSQYVYDKTVAKITEDGVPIPSGFAHEAGTTKEEGLVIVDVEGNEFVWVPVTEKLQLVSTFGTFETIIGEEPGFVARRDNREKNRQAIKEDKYEDSSDGLKAQFNDEYNDMVTSVEIYGGFYVGRYETSWNGNRVASVSNVDSMKSNTDLGVSWSTDKGTNSSLWYGLYAKQKELYNKDYDCVVSGMIYGCQWDAIMNWMLQGTDEEKLFVTNSEGKGNYSGKAKATGSNDEYKVKNIYDLAGNYVEFTQELPWDKTNAKISEYHRAVRGGRYDTPSQAQAAFRGTGGVDSASGIYSSRLQLYIK